MQKPASLSLRWVAALHRFRWQHSRGLNEAEGVEIVDNPANNEYPMPLDAQGRDEVFVGRIRRDESQINSINLWIVADNLRKGAATNAVQIVELLQAKNLIG